MAQSKLDVIRKLVDSFNRRDLDAQLELLTDDYEWHPAFTGGGLLEGNAYRGHEGYRRYWQALAETWATISLEIEELRDLGDRVLALARIHAIGRVSGVEVDQPFGGIWKLRDGKLAAGRAYRTQDEALRAAEKAP